MEDPLSTLKNILALFGFFLAYSSTAAASEIGTGGHRFGLGLSVGYPTGLSAKYYPGGRSQAIEGVLAVDPGIGDGGIYLHAAYLWHPDVLAREPGFELPWHVGIGGFLWDDYYGWGYGRWGAGGTAIGGRGQIGLDFDLEDIRLQISADVSLHIGVFTGGFLFYDVPIAITVRYFF